MTNHQSRRLYVPGSLKPGAEVRLDEERAHYVGRVLRLKVGDELVLFNGEGGERIAVITETAKRGAVLRVGAHCGRVVESPLKIRLVQGISRGERMDFVVQKATELGVHRITPVVTGRTVVRFSDDKSRKRAAHWTKVAQSACEQCGRNVMPLIDAPQSLRTWIEDSAPDGTARLLLHPEARRPLASLAGTHEQFELLIGPEGGLTDAEYTQAKTAGFADFSLGPRILRTETAAIAAISILQSRWGDLA